jgi:hypothetical protein
MNKKESDEESLSIFIGNTKCESLPDSFKLISFYDNKTTEQLLDNAVIEVEVFNDKKALTIEIVAKPYYNGERDYMYHARLFKDMIHNYLDKSTRFSRRREWIPDLQVTFKDEDKEFSTIGAYVRIKYKEETK